MKVNVYQVKLQKVNELEIQEADQKINNPRKAAYLLQKYLLGADREHLVVVLLNSKYVVNGIHTAHVGSLTSSVIHPREIFKVAILHNAAGILLGHNHPSGDTSPSIQDVVVTEKIEQAGNLMGIPLQDHIIVGNEDTSVEDCVSMRELGILTELE